MRRLVVMAAVFGALIALSGTGVASASDVRAPAIIDEVSCAGGTAGGAQETHHAGLVIVFDEERVETLCIEFTEDEISGAELLRRSGLPVVLTGFGGLGAGVCRIDDVGCSDPTDCFCQCRGAECSYWAYHAFEDGEWDYLPVGASQRRLQDGDADAWVWGAGRDEPATTGSVCPEVAATPTATPRPPSADASAPSATPAASSGETVAGRPTAAPEPPTPSPATVRASATSQVRRDVVDDGPVVDRDVDAVDAGSDGMPPGLIAFGAVAGVAVVALGGLVAWRRLRG